MLCRAGAGIYDDKAMGGEAAGIGKCGHVVDLESIGGFVQVPFMV